MPEVTGTVLCRLNAHPRDERITFQDEGHVYTVDGVPGTYTSVTTLIHKFFPHFDADAVIAKITQYPKSAYFGQDPQDIKDQWARATDLGSQLHAQIECFFDDLVGMGGISEIVAPSVEFGYFLDYFRDHVVGKMTPYRTEMYVFDEDIQVCGSIDMLFCDPDDHHKLWIVDWKRSKEIRKRNAFERGYGCLANFDNCNFITYSLQLNMYKYILEAKYGKTVIGMALVILHPNHSGYMVVPVDNMQAEIQKMLATKDNVHGHDQPTYQGNVAKYF